jgi:DamX protein
MSAPNSTTAAQDTETAPAYVPQLGAHRDPFPSQVDGIFFEHPALVQRLNLLEHLTGFSNLVLVVTGPQGSGKSTLLQRLMARAAEHWRVCHIEANAMMDADQVLRLITECFDLPAAPGRDALLSDLTEHLSRLREGGRLAVLLVDDAHELPAQALETVLLLAEDRDQESPLLRIVLFGEPPVRALLESPTLKPLTERLVHPLELPPLPQDQTGAYLAHRLRAAGIRDRSPFDVTQIEQIAKEGHGIPGRINGAARRVLLGRKARAAPAAKSRAERKPAEAKARARRLAAGLGTATAVALVGAALLLQDRINLLFQAEAPPEAEPTQLVPQRTLPLDLPGTPPEAEHPEPITRTPPPRGQLPGVETTTRRAESTMPPDAGESHEIPTVTEQPPDEEGATVAKAREETGPETAPPVPVASGSEGKPAKPAPPPRTESEPSRPPAQPSPPAARTPPVARREDWLLAQKPTNYTLQLLGVSEEPSVLAFIKRHGLEGRVAYFHTYRDGTDWYALVYGIYANREAARAARSTLPAAVQKQDPWPRSLASVHTDINKAR